MRGGREHFTYSKAMAWVAFDRAIKSAEKYDLPGPLDRWREIRERIHNDVCAHGFDDELCSFVRSLRLEGARRQPAAAAGDRISAARRTRASSAPSRRSSAG